MYIFCLHIKVFRRQILSLDRKCVSEKLYLALFCIHIYPCERVYCALMYGFALESILKVYNRRYLLYIFYLYLGLSFFRGSSRG